MMKKILLLLLLTVVVFSYAEATVIEVGSNKKIKNIQEAISKAKAYDTVVVYGGIYKEKQINIEKALTLIGKNNAILDGEHKYEILNIQANDVRIIGFTFQNTGFSSMEDLAAIKVSNVKNVILEDNKVINAFFGIYFAHCKKSVVRNNVLTATAKEEHQIGNGIHMWQSDSMHIVGNHISGHRDGIYFEFVTNSLIENNRSDYNLRYGLHFMFSHDDTYKNNYFGKNGAGVAVMYTKGVKMLNNFFEENWGDASYGLLLKDIRDSEVLGNQFIKNSIAIYMEGSSRILFKQNVFKENGYGIRLQASCDENDFVRNNFQLNTFDIATNGNLVLNRINGNFWDRYEGYDLNKDGVGDVPYRPVSLYAMVVERVPAAVLLWRSFLVFLIDRAEKALPVVTPENLKDESPSMRPYDFTK
jgi:nitrous oxidase accessory protein